jgi:hypothetical protein
LIASIETHQRDRFQEVEHAGVRKVVSTFRQLLIGPR